MDSKLFRLPTQPNYYASIATAPPFDTAAKAKYSQLPTADSRFPGYAAPMSDGRLVTDYLPECSKNVPAGRQFGTKEWMTKNAVEIIRIGRERYAQQSGASFANAETIPPPASIIECSSSDCSRRATGKPGGIGTERITGPLPYLFGTWEPNMAGVAPKTHIPVGRPEGGRNSVRG
jgi:hypothetical protein